MTIHPALSAYLDELVEQLGNVIELEAVYLVGSGSYGGFEPGRSDVDVIAVVPRPLGLAEKQALVDTAEGLPCPGRVEQDAVLQALRASLEWHEREEPVEANGLLNACRAWRWLETGEWGSKPEAAAWLRSNVRAAIEEAR